MQQGGEPSLEEILASIKQVIERESGQSIGPSDRPGPHPAGRAAPGGAEPATEEEAADVLDLGEAGVLIREGESHGASEVAGGHFSNRAASGGLSVNPAAAASVRRSLAALEALSRPGATRELVDAGQLSLDDLARAMLRPMLADWLDRNLPPLVERLVQAELARIVNRPD